MYMPKKTYMSVIVRRTFIRISTLLFIGELEHEKEILRLIRSKYDSGNDKSGIKYTR